MKRVFFLLIGILAFSVACQDDFIETESELSGIEKSASLEKSKTFEIHGYVKALPKEDGAQIECNPPEAEIFLIGSGWVSGHDNIFGKFDQENSTYEKEFCEFAMTPEGPVVYTKTNVILQRMNGDEMFVVNHMWINVANGEISGYSDVTGGTGRFEGVLGRAEMLDARIDAETGIASWEEEGYITMVLKN